MAKKVSKNKYLVILGAILLLGVSAFFLSEKQPNMDNFKAPGRDWNSPKKVESYFVERLRMTPEEALKMPTAIDIHNYLEILSKNPEAFIFGFFGHDEKGKLIEKDIKVLK